MPKREEVTVGGRVYRLKKSLLEREYAPLSFTEDYIYNARTMAELGSVEGVPKEIRAKLEPYWVELCKLFFDDITGLSFDEIDNVDMGKLNDFFGECAVSMIRVQENVNVTSVDSSTAPGQ